MKATREQLVALAEETGVSDPGTIWDTLEAKYSAPGRHYHTLEHVGWVLHRLDQIVGPEPWGGTALDDAKWAAWFHDAEMSFSAAGKDDERRSAELAESMLKASGYGTPCRVAQLVMDTAHSEQFSAQTYAKALVDADLAVLAAPRADFDEYERLVRLEWSDFSDEEFRIGRRAVLLRFAGMRRIFNTEYGYHQWERKARFNLSQSIENLEKEMKHG